MKILYDYQIYAVQKFGGISRYFYELTKQFSQNDIIEVNTPILLSYNHYISDRKYIKHIPFSLDFKGKNRVLLFVNKLFSIFSLKTRDYDLFHPTYYDPYFLEYIGERPFVLTVHDLTHEKFPDSLLPGDKSVEQKKLLLAKAAKIIAVSNNTKHDLVEIYNINPSKIEVIYHGNSMVVEKSLESKIDVPKKYILFVGERKGYKNFIRFAKAAKKVLNDDVNLSLVCIGGNCFSKEEIDMLSELSLENRVYQYDINDDTLAHFYYYAELFVFPSLYEGFGIPILEAFACGCPIACSNTSALPEITGDAAVLFDPYSIDSMSEVINEVLHDKVLQKELVSKGKKRLEFFSWEKTAKQTVNVYKKILR